ncbi:MAG TPA: aldose 1-epimerase family protein [Planctomycetaceae bacterium]|nr:aldose 1-epimerase family protein [Planctomycetaceae bacterium]
MIRTLVVAFTVICLNHSPLPAQEDTWRYVLIDSATNVNVGKFSLSNAKLGIESESPWSVTMKTLHGGKQEGVQLVTIDNGNAVISLIPTRGLSIYEVKSGDVRLGWNSPVKELVHPQYINLDARGGLGWLDGFNEWMVRCGLEFAGHPGTDEFITNTGEMGEMDLTLHGKIGNIPASKVELLIDKQPPHRIRLRGVVHERLFFGPKLQLTAEVSTIPGSTALTIRDEVTNLGGSEQEYQLIYHTNFGPPLLEAGAQAVAPIKTLAPMNEQAAKGLKEWNLYREPTPGFVEEVFLIHPYADPTGQTGVLLKNKAGDRGSSIHWNIGQLPFLTIWKNTVAEADGYVTGLEPATGFPYNRKIERKAGRVPVLKPGEAQSIELEFRLHLSRQNVQDAIDTILKYQDGRPTEVQSEPPPEGGE